MIWELPKALEVGGRAWAINTDYRDVLVILEAFEDPELTDHEKAYICLHNLYIDFEALPTDRMREAYEAAVGFIDCGAKGGGQKTMDWEQDAPLIFPAVNQVAGFEVRGVEYLHWWTFVGYFMEIKDSTYATVLSLRQKKVRGKKLEKHEREYWEQNSEICRLRARKTQAELDEERRLNEILG